MTLGSMVHFLPLVGPFCFFSLIKIIEMHDGAVGVEGVVGSSARFKEKLDHASTPTTGF
jgi:hypothetical protein